jgi:uncharacterized protein YndB with AHSA1/START domain
MKATDQTTPVLVVRRQMAVPRERVFAAWLNSESLAHWMLPGARPRRPSPWIRGSVAASGS